MSVEHAPFQEPADDDLSIFDIAGPEQDARREAEADIAAGLLIPMEEVANWLKTWGTPN